MRLTLKGGKKKRSPRKNGGTRGGHHHCPSMPLPSGYGRGREKEEIGKAIRIGKRKKGKLLNLRERLIIWRESSQGLTPSRSTMRKRGTPSSVSGERREGGTRGLSAGVGGKRMIYARREHNSLCVAQGREKVHESVGLGEEPLEEKRQ